jgi:hypothetical protein
VRLSADVSSRSMAVRRVLLRLLLGVKTVYTAFHGALDATTGSSNFMQLQQAPEGVAVDVGGIPVASRELGVVARELKDGLRVGACSALERILQVQHCCACNVFVMSCSHLASASEAMLFALVLKDAYRALDHLLSTSHYSSTT